MNNQNKIRLDKEKLKLLMLYWFNHNNEHIRDNEKWLQKINDMGLADVSDELKKVIKLSKEANEHIKLANTKLKKEYGSKTIKENIVEKQEVKSERSSAKNKIKSFKFKQIGIIRTPYTDSAPYQPIEGDTGEFCIVLEPQYIKGFYKLSKFSYIYVLYYIHRIEQKMSMTVSPGWTDGEKVGVFASRSPVRPNNIGLSIVSIKRIVNNKILTSGLDVFDKTPLLEIKPYIKDLDSKSDANYGWVADIDDYKHLLLHIKGIPHAY